MAHKMDQKLGSLMHADRLVYNSLVKLISLLRSTHITLINKPHLCSCTQLSLATDLPFFFSRHSSSKSAAVRKSFDLLLLILYQPEISELS